MTTTTTKTTWCVCGTTDHQSEPWELIEAGLPSEQAAEQWIRDNMASHPEITSWYADREENDGLAAAYYDVRDGELVLVAVN